MKCEWIEQTLVEQEQLTETWTLTFRLAIGGPLLVAARKAHGPTLRPVDIPQFVREWALTNTVPNPNVLRSEATWKEVLECADQDGVVRVSQRRNGAIVTVQLTHTVGRDRGPHLYGSMEVGDSGSYQDVYLPLDASQEEIEKADQDLADEVKYIEYEGDWREPCPLCHDDDDLKVGCWECDGEGTVVKAG